MIDKDEALAFLERHVAMMGEQFDSIQVFATRVEPGPDGATESFTTGIGNWYARHGQAREWVRKQEASATEQRGCDGEEEGAS